MSTFRRWIITGFVSSSTLWDLRSGGDTPVFAFTEGAWVYGWQGDYVSHKILGAQQVGAVINVQVAGSYYEIPSPEALGSPPVASSQAAIQALIDAGATLYTIGASVGGSAPGDSRIDTVITGPVVNVSDFPTQFQYTINASAIGFPNPELTITLAVGGVTLEIPDVVENILAEVEWNGGVTVMKGLASGNPTLVSSVIGDIVPPLVPVGGPPFGTVDNNGEDGCIDAGAAAADGGASGCLC